MLIGWLKRKIILRRLSKSLDLKQLNKVLREHEKNNKWRMDSDIEIIMKPLYPKSNKYLISVRNHSDRMLENVKIDSSDLLSLECFGVDTTHMKIAQNTPPIAFDKIIPRGGAEVIKEGAGLPIKYDGKRYPHLKIEYDDGSSQYFGDRYRICIGEVQLANARS